MGYVRGTLGTREPPPPDVYATGDSYAPSSGGSSGGSTPTTTTPTTSPTLPRTDTGGGAPSPDLVAATDGGGSGGGSGSSGPTGPSEGGVQWELGPGPSGPSGGEPILTPQFATGDQGQATSSAAMYVIGGIVLAAILARKSRKEG